MIPIIIAMVMKLARLMVTLRQLILFFGPDAQTAVTPLFSGDTTGLVMSRQHCNTPTTAYHIMTQPAHATYARAPVPGHKLYTAITQPSTPLKAPPTQPLRRPNVNHLEDLLIRGP